MQYPNPNDGVHSSGWTYTYAFDSMGRPLSLTDNQTHPVQWVQNAQYNVANQLLSASYSPGYTETRHYNTLLQMDEQKFTTPTSGGNPAMDLHYNFSPNANNGKILGVTESVTGETINYAYDTLNRLISASGAGNPGLGAWGETFIFDGFGNLTDKNASGNATSVHMVVDPATNRLQGLNQSDPKTGNLTAIGNMALTYDVANRVSTVAVSSAPAGMYGYDQDNHRVWTSGDQIHFFGAFGERLATFQPVSQGSPYLTQVTTDLYFAGRRIVSNGQVIMTDRLGSMRYGSNQASNFWFYPYGEEPSTTAQDRDKFATYFRDSTTGLDYAQNRYYSSILGRFLTADPSNANDDFTNPPSLNQYAYVNGDPVNDNDPTGLGDYCNPGQSARAAQCVYIGGLSGSYPATGMNPGTEGLDTTPFGGNNLAPGAGPTVGSIITNTLGDIFGGLLGPFLVGILAPTPTGGAVPTVRELEARCKTGRLVVEPATGVRYKGGTSYEQEYMSRGALHGSLDRERRKDCSWPACT